MQGHPQQSHMLRSEVHTVRLSNEKPTLQPGHSHCPGLQAGPPVPTEWHVQANSIAVRYEAPQEAMPAPADAGASFQVWGELSGWFTGHTCCSRRMLLLPFATFSLCKVPC